MKRPTWKWTSQDFRRLLSSFEGEHLEKIYDSPHAYPLYDWKWLSSANNTWFQCTTKVCLIWISYSKMMRLKVSFVSDPKPNRKADVKSVDNHIINMCLLWKILECWFELCLPYMHIAQRYSSFCVKGQELEKDINAWIDHMAKVVSFSPECWSYVDDTELYCDTPSQVLKSQHWN